jgi:DNA-directed RNA polymerase specialized sigma24 family protein
MNVLEAVEALRGPARAAKAHNALAEFARRCLIAKGYNANVEERIQVAITKFNRAHENGQIHGTTVNEFNAFFSRIIVNVAIDDYRKQKKLAWVSPFALEAGYATRGESDSDEPRLPEGIAEDDLSTNFDDAPHTPDLTAIRALLQRAADDTLRTYKVNRVNFQEAFMQILAIEFDGRKIDDFLPADASATVRNNLYKRHERCRKDLRRTAERIQVPGASSDFTREEACLVAQFIKRL